MSKPPRLNAHRCGFFLVDTRKYRGYALATMMQLPLFQTFSVSELTYYLRQLFESDEILQDVWVAGEISNLSQPRSGHIYFTLKDENAALHCVIWKSTASRIRAALADGAAVEVHGAISIYERSGQYQLYVSSLKMAGEGNLYQEFLRLKSKLEAEGLFDEDNKKPLPQFPHRIGIVTSPTGAALQDMLNTLQKRFPLAEVILSPAAVQGDAAPPEIVHALDMLDQIGSCDVILLCRGGGSLEDLWAFNDEDVVRTVASLDTPVITGIGHETDFTLADFASDLRAPTPTGAAVTATPDILEIRSSLATNNAAIDQAMGWLLEDRKKAVGDLSVDLKRLSPARRILNDRQRLDELDIRQSKSMAHLFQLEKSHLAGINNRLENLSPEAVFKRGYAIVKNEKGNIIRNVNEIREGEHMQVFVRDGKITGLVEEITEEPFIRKGE